MSSAGEVYLSGSDRPRGGATTPPKPYLEKINVKTGEKTRIFEGKGETTETIDAVDGNDVKLVFTTRQKRDVVPNSFMTDLASGTVTQNDFYNFQLDAAEATSICQSQPISPCPVQAGDYDYAEMISGDLYESLSKDPSVQVQRTNAPIFGLFFMASDLMVISHKPGFICLAAHTAADPESIRNTSMDKAARRMRTPDDG